MEKYPSSSQNKEQAKPKIIINPEQTGIKIETIRHGVKLEGRHLDFFQQKNGSDCGPCMCLNIQDALNAKTNDTYVKDVQQFREWASANSQNNYTGEQRYGWLRDDDINRYITGYLGLEQSSLHKPTRQDITEILTRPRDKFIWAVRGRHYYGFFQSAQSGNLYEFNSFNETPILRGEEDLLSFCENSMRENPDNAIVRVVFASESERDQNETPKITFNEKPKIEIKNRSDSQLQRIQNKLGSVLRG